MAELIAADGRRVSCHEPSPGCYFAKDVWAVEEAKEYAKTGKYPIRLLEQIRLKLDAKEG